MLLFLLLRSLFVTLLLLPAAAAEKHVKTTVFFALNCPCFGAQYCNGKKLWSVSYVNKLFPR